MTFVRAIETPDGANIVFSSPIGWGAEGPTVTLNGRTLTDDDYVILSGFVVQFRAPPGIGDEVGFFVTPLFD